MRHWAWLIIFLSAVWLTPPAAAQSDGQPQGQAPNQQGRAPEVPSPVAAVPPGGPTQLSAGKAAALGDLQTAMTELRKAQQSGNFDDYGAALQRLSDAMDKYDTAK